MTEPKNLPARSSICIVALWLGKYPPYLNCFLRSCASNSDIDWLIVTENAAPNSVPPNVRFQVMTRAELLSQFTKKLGFEPAPPDTSCSARTAFGFAFRELLEKYDFWGYCDLDVIFGDLRRFLTEDILTRHDKILTRGHLTLYRNVESVNRAFMLPCPGVPNYMEDFKINAPTQFDEVKGVNLIFRYHGLPQFYDEFIADIAPPPRWKITRFEGTAIQNFPEQVFYWHKGKVFRARYNCDRGIVDDEYAYLHFQKRPLPAPDFDPFSVNGFLITPDGFFPYDREPLNAGDFARYNRARWQPASVVTRLAWRSLKRRLGLTPSKSSR